MLLTIGVPRKRTAGPAHGGQGQGKWWFPTLFPEADMLIVGIKCLPESGTRNRVNMWAQDRRRLGDEAGVLNT